MREQEILEPGQIALQQLQKVKLPPLLFFESIERLGFPGVASGKEPTCQCTRLKRHGFDSWVGKFSSKRKWQSIPEFLLEKSHGQRSLVV